MFELSEAAAADIEEILERSLIEFGVAQTEQYVESFQRCLALLGENPRMGSSAEDVRTGYRRFIHKSHVVLYREADSGIFVVRVLHSRMDVGSAFAEQPKRPKQFCRFAASSVGKARSGRSSGIADHRVNRIDELLPWNLEIPTVADQAA